MDFADASFDGVICRWGFMLMPDPAAAFRECRRVLVPGGRLVFAVFTGPDENPFASIPARVLAEAGHMPPPTAEWRPGILALADRARGQRAHGSLHPRRRDRAAVALLGRRRDPLSVSPRAAPGFDSGFTMAGTEPTRRTFVRAIGAGTAAIAASPVFAPGRAFAGALHASAGDADIHLNFNESPYGPSPRALAAVRDASVAVVSRYFPEDTYDTLRDALAAHHGVTRAHIRVTAGSTEVLKVCDDVFLAGGAALVVAEPAYEAVIQYAANSKANAVKVPLTADHRHDLMRMAGATSAATGLVYICNPNNPTGTIVRKPEVAAFLDRVPPSVTVLVDEAYAEFVTDPGYESALRYVHEGRNVIVAKTFSKIHGLAGMRVGYAVAKPALIARLAPFTVDYAPTGTAANAALASLGDREYRVTVAQRNAAQRSAFMAEMRRLGLACAESHANFAMVDIRRPVGPVIAALAKRHVLVGRVFDAMPTFLRVTLGTEREMGAFYAAFRDVIRA